MEPLLKQLQNLPALLAGMRARQVWLLAGGLVLALMVAAAVALSSRGEDYQYAFTNLTPEDSTEAAATLKSANVPFRLEAGGAALAVPGTKVHDVRLLLAQAGLPRGGGVGFELFDRGDLGVTEFTQKVNLRRALEGELARTISRLSEVRSARVHLSLPERGLLRDDERRASAAVALTLQPGRTLGHKESAGIRHLVASAVPGLAPSDVTLVDGSGTVLGEEAWGAEGMYQNALERDLERRIVTLLEPVVGTGAVMARVTATLDASEVQQQSEAYDPEAVALKSERKVSANQDEQGPSVGGVAGAAANQPLLPEALMQRTGNRNAANSQDETRTFEVSKTTTQTIHRSPRLQRLSVAILLDGNGTNAKSTDEVTRLGELAKRAVGFDAERGDQLDISAVAFTAPSDTTPVPAPTAVPVWQRPPVLVGGVAALGVLGVLATWLLLRGRRPTPQAAPLVLKPGMRVAELERALEPEPVPARPEPISLPHTPNEPPALPDPSAAVRDRARVLASQEVHRTVHLLRAWLAEEPLPPSDEVSHAS